MKKLLCVFAGMLGLAGCGSVDVEHYAEETPVLDLREYFDGTLDAHGIFQDRSGEVVKRFHAVIEASWEGDTGTLDERFTYSDGTTQRRVWTIVRHDAHTYTGTAGDVIGEAKGEARGNALRWRYVLELPVDGKTWHVNFDDWMFLMDERVMLNRSEMSKFGVRLGEVTLSFYKRDA
tara:strand:+ start:282 stop:812 length:531 start_codon:yes stop_codon:yes gene_type:complete